MNRRAFITQAAMAGTATTLLPFLTGCTSQQTAAGIIGDIGAALVTILSIENVDAAIVAKVTADYKAAQVAVLNWVSGTPAQNVIQLLNIFIGDLNLLPVSQKAAALITLAINLTESLIIMFGGAPGVVGGAKARPAWSGDVILPSDKQLKALRAANKAKWNAAIGSDMKYSQAKIK